MCRLTAYCGPSIPLENIIVSPSHSLICQSMQSNEAKLTHNGDGFGIAWYGRSNQPGLYRDVLPAWSDGNLQSVCRMVESHLFLAHVRAATGTETSRENCHPFVHKNWSFMHNGQIGDFARIRRKIEAELPDDLYDRRKGSTDSELFFLLALAYGLADNPQSACQRALDRVTTYQHELGGQERTRLTCVMSDSESLYGFRHSSDNHAPTLYHSKSLTHGGFALASEPLDNDGANWRTVPEGGFLSFTNNRLRMAELNTGLPLAA